MLQHTINGKVGIVVMFKRASKAQTKLQFMRILPDTLNPVREPEVPSQAYEARPDGIMC